MGCQSDKADDGTGIPGLYVPSDPGAPDADSKKGMMSMSFGKLFEKGLSIGTGQCNVKKYSRSSIILPRVTFRLN